MYIMLYVRDHSMVSASDCLLYGMVTRWDGPRSHCAHGLAACRSSLPESARARALPEACEPGQVVFVEKPCLVALPALSPKLWEHLQKLHEAWRGAGRQGGREAGRQVVRGSI